MTPSMQIMVVDDEETICEALAAWFAKDGHQVQIANSGPEGLACLEDCLFDVYLVDIKMPGMDGLEFLARLKEKTSGCQCHYDYRARIHPDGRGSHETGGQ